MKGGLKAVAGFNFQCLDARGAKKLACLTGKSAKDRVR